MTSLLHTDAYKFSMAEAGWPLRKETFTFTCRRGGPHYLPFDVEEVVQSLLPKLDGLDVDLRYLDSVGYAMGGGFRAALAGPLTVSAIP